MNVYSLFSGIGGMDAGLARAGFRHIGLCESDSWRRSILAARFPGVPIAEDVRSVPLAHGRGGIEPDDSQGGRDFLSGRDAASRIDLLCGGFPCQDVSVAGKRAGLAGARSGLFHEFMRIADELVPPGGYVLIENVPGLFSSHAGRDFAVVLASLAELGFLDGAWRVLDSRYFGVPQRRRRVFILARRARGQCCAEILLEPESGGGNFAPGRKTREEVAGTLGENSSHGGGEDRMTLLASESGKGWWKEGEARLRSQPGGMPQNLVAASLSHGSNPNSNAAGRRREDDVNLVPITFDDQRGRANGGFGFDEARTLHRAKGQSEMQMVTHALSSVGADAREDGTGRGAPLVTTALTCHSAKMGDPTTDIYHVAAPGVRRLTPTECERLQALPDGWTLPGADSKRYAGLGDAVTASVAEWIGRRILANVAPLFAGAEETR